MAPKSCVMHDSGAFIIYKEHAFRPAVSGRYPAEESEAGLHQSNEEESNWVQKPRSVNSLS